MNTQSLTLSHLNKLFYYDGRNLIRRVARGGQKVGDVAGNVSKTRGYRRITVDRKTYSVHRLVWFMVYGKWPDNEIDHINGVRDDNRIKNLRDVTASINLRNQNIYDNNSSGITGVCWHKATEKWQARIYLNGKRKHLGLFDCKYRAASTRMFAQEIDGGYTSRHGN